MTSICPKCEEDIFQDLYEEFMERIDFSKHYAYVCPHCHAQLDVSMDWNFIVETVESEQSKEAKQ